MIIPPQQPTVPPTPRPYRRGAEDVSRGGLSVENSDCLDLVLKHNRVSEWASRESIRRPCASTARERFSSGRRCRQRARGDGMSPDIDKVMHQVRPSKCTRKIMSTFLLRTCFIANLPEGARLCRTESKIAPAHGTNELLDVVECIYPHSYCSSLMMVSCRQCPEWWVVESAFDNDGR